MYTVLCELTDACASAAHEEGLVQSSCYFLSDMLHLRREEEAFDSAAVMVENADAPFVDVRSAVKDAAGSVVLIHVFPFLTILSTGCTTSPWTR